MKIEIDENSADQRLDRFLRKYCKPYSDVKLSDIFSWLRKGVVKVGNAEEGIDISEYKYRKRKENYRLQLGDVVSFSDKIDFGGKSPILLVASKEEKLKNIKKKDVQKMVVFENENWLVFNKPDGVVMHPNNKHENDLSMHDYLGIMSDLPLFTSSLENEEEGSKNIDNNSTFKPSFCFRLDKDTSGVLVAAKTYDSLKYLNKIIRDREVDKHYLTVVGGEFPEYIRIDKPLEKGYSRKFDRGQTVVSKSGKESLSEAWNVKTIDHNSLGKISLVKVKIHTGRMHQIRVHLQSEGFPVLGDIIYGNPALNRILYKNLKINRQLLHCWVYSFWDIFDHKKIVLKAGISSDFEKLGFKNINN